MGRLCWVIGLGLTSSRGAVRGALSNHAGKGHAPRNGSPNVEGNVFSSSVQEGHGFATTLMRAQEGPCWSCDRQSGQVIHWCHSRPPTLPQQQQRRQTVCRGAEERGPQPEPRRQRQKGTGPLDAEGSRGQGRTGPVTERTGHEGLGRGSQEWLPGPPWRPGGRSTRDLERAPAGPTYCASETFRKTGGLVHKHVT